MRRGIVLVPGGPPALPLAQRRGEPADRRLRRRRGRWTLDRVYALFPILGERRAQPATHALRRPAADVRHRPRADGDPRLLLCDEISLGLAPIVIRDIYAVLPTIKAEGTAIVVVEQDIVQALAVADRVYCFQEGRMTLSGAPGRAHPRAIHAAYFGRVQR